MAGMSDYLKQQLWEALGPVNKWYCSQYHGYEVTSPDQLLAYYIKHGGARQFRQRHADELPELTPALAPSQRT